MSHSDDSPFNRLLRQAQQEGKQCFCSTLRLLSLVGEHKIGSAVSHGTEFHHIHIFATKVQDALAALIGTVLLLTCDSSAVIPECSICACNIWNAFFLLMNKEIAKHYRLLRQKGKLNSTNTIAASFMYNKVLKPLDVQDKITNATFPLSFVYNNLLTGFV